MGLAAGQARLLSITARKSDCEFQSMRLSHQKIALARELADISNEYQNSLNQTKLVYDYYGTGDTSTPLTYGLMMSPSALNDYMPIMLTSSDGRVVLNNKLALAAAAAGIPQEGLGTLPSEELRNRFIIALGSDQVGVISQDLSDRIISLPYNQRAGFGGGATVAVQTKDVNLNELAEYLNAYSSQPLGVSFLDVDFTEYVGLYDVSKNQYYIQQVESGSKIGSEYNGYLNNATCSVDPDVQINLGDLLNGDYVLLASTQGNANSTMGNAGGAIDAIVNSSIWDDMFAACEELFDTGDGFVQSALEYAKAKTSELIDFNVPTRYNDNDQHNVWRYCNNATQNENFVFEYLNRKDNNGNVVKRAYEQVTKDGYIGITMSGNKDTGTDDKHDYKSVLSVNISNIMKAYLTYFTDYINGIAKTDSFGVELYDVNKQVSSSHLVNASTMFAVKVGQSVSSDDLGQATFYDAMFNQICANGWVENNNVEDKDYLQQMLQNGMMFVSRVNEDNYYYQGNYATDSYIKEISDESAIAYAEAKYSTEKAKLNSKEETIDLKMKNLDTEISSLTTEYDTVKSTISKSIEKSFKRYSA